MAYYELHIDCERCHTRAIFVGMSGRRSAVAAARSNGWYPAVGTVMWVCDECQQECPRCEGEHDPELPCVTLSAEAEDRRTLRV